MENNSNKKINRMVGMGVLAAIIIILQLFVSSIKIGPFSITLALVPIIVGALLYGPRSGAILGFVFGLVVVYCVVAGIDAGGYLMFQEEPVITCLVCLLKSTAAGLVSGLIFKKMDSIGKGHLGAIIAAMVCPIINTGILAIAMITIYSELVNSWAVAAGSASAVIYIITGMLGINFIIEFVVNVILSPVIYRIIRIISK